MTAETVEFLDFQFDDITLAEAIGAFKASDSVHAFRYAVTPNVDHVVRYHRELNQAGGPLLVEAYERATWRFCDSRILALLARRAGLSLSVVPGSDLTAALLNASEAGDRICIIGGDEDTLPKLQQSYPLRDFVQFQPPMGLRSKPEAMAATVAFVVSAGARYIFLAVGSPQQELLALAIANQGNATGIGFCVGASIDFLTGKAKRAPLWMQKLHIEWAHRLMTNPARLWRRYLIEGPRIFLLFRSWRKKRDG